MSRESAIRFPLEKLSPVAAVTRSGHSLHDDESERLVRPLLGRVPITRVYELTALDTLGLPVWAAVTPLARDLTVHAGKGLTDAAARLSAIFEAIERVSAESAQADRVVRASYAELLRESTLRPLDPEVFDLPFETMYSRDRPITWTVGHDLISGEDVLVATDLVVSPATEGVCSGPETNGLAAGTSMTEAAVHALYEVIERDALAVQSIRRLHGDADGADDIRMIDAASVPDEPRGVVERLERGGTAVRIQDITSSVDVPAYRACVVDSQFPLAEGRPVAVFEGSGANIDAERALTRALTEAAQAHSSLFLGARDSFEGMAPRHVRPATQEWDRHVLTSRQLEPFRPRPAPSTGGLLDELHLLTSGVAGDGARHCVVVDLTDPRLAIPVARVLVPGFAPIYGETRRRPGTRLLRQLVPHRASDA